MINKFCNLYQSYETTLITRTIIIQQNYSDHYYEDEHLSENYYWDECKPEYYRGTLNYITFY